MIDGHNGAKLDCMFFPCAIDDQFEISIENPVG